MFRHRSVAGRVVSLIALTTGIFVANAAHAATAATSALSRRMHGATTIDIPLPMVGNTGIEARSLGGAPTIVILFDQPISAGTAAVTGGTGSVAAGGVTRAGNAMLIPLTGVANAQAVTVTAQNVVGSDGGTLAGVSVTFRTLVGDFNGDGSVTQADVDAIAALVGQPVDGFTHRADLDANGSITAADVNTASAAVGTTVAGGAIANTPPTINDVGNQTGVTGAAGTPIGLSIGDAETAAASLGLRATSSNPTLVPSTGFSFGGTGTARTLTITPASGQTGTATITIEVGDGLAVTADTFTLTVTPPPKLFTAYMRPEGSAVTPGSGFATLMLSGDETYAVLKANYSNLTTPEVAKHIHGPAGPAANAGILFDIDTAEYNEADQSWRWDIVQVGTHTPADVVAAIKSGNTYINIHSSQYPSGEIRGQFVLSTGSQTFTPPPAPPALPGGPPTSQDAARFLQQATFGPTSAEITRVTQIGFDAWLNEQFATPLHKLVTQPAGNTFENPIVGTGSMITRPRGAGWTFEGNSGITGNRGKLTLPVAPNFPIDAPHFNQAAFVKATGKVRQTFSVAQPGKYIVSFLAAPRTNMGNQPTLVLRVNNVVQSTQALNRNLTSSDPGRYNAFFTLPIQLAAGNHEVSFEGTTTGTEDTAMFDDVRIFLASSHAGIVRARLGSETDQINSANTNINTWWRVALTGDDQLRQRVAFAYSQIFVVSAQDGSINGRPGALGHWHDMLADNAFANFRDLLKDVTLHPIMGQYLNMRGNTKPISPLFTAPNENYAREVLQLFSTGLNELQPDGTLKLGSNGLPIATYDQSIIEGFSHVFTGWNAVGTGTTANNRIPVLRNVTVAVAGGGTTQRRRIQNYNDNYSAPMVVNAANTSNSSKKLLSGVVIPARATQTTATATAELETAIDNIFNHPNVGPFICRQLIQRMVASNPSPAYVYRVAQVFNNDGTGVRGNMRAVVKAILTDYEARTTTVLANQGVGRLREPLIRVTSSIRPFSPTSQTAGRFAINTTDTQLGQTPYRSPTVFNFYEPFYVHPGQLADNGLHAPEFQISTEIMAVNVPNFLQTGIYNSGATATFQGGDIRLNLTTEQNLASNVGNLIDHLNLLLMSGQMPSNMRSELITEVSKIGGAAPSATDRLNRARLAVFMITSSTQCAVQR